MTFLELKQALRAEIWPSGEAKTLRTAHDKYFLEAIIDLETWIDGLQVNNTSVIPFCDTFFNCGSSVINAPIGRIKSVYSIANEEWCDKVYYRFDSYRELRCWQWNLLKFSQPADLGLPVLAEGFKRAERTTDIHPDTEKKYLRARTGIWTIQRRKLWVAPWLQSNESIVVEWDGVKSFWNDSDPLDENYWTPDALACIKLYVQIAHERDFGCEGDRLMMLREEYQEARADLFWYFQQLEKPPEDHYCFDTRLPTSTEVEDEEVSETAEPDVVFAQIGDFGVDDVNEQAVADLVAGWTPSFIVTTGDNNYGEIDYDLAVGQYYSAFIFPYSGAFGAGATENKFWPVPGKNDWFTYSGLEFYLTFFGLPFNERYYELVRGYVHFFFLSTDAEEPDGRTATSTQAAWLRRRLALSTAKWKVIVMHDSPYTTGGTNVAETDLRWPFKDWGADLVLSGGQHFYERLEVDGLPFVVNGAGGAMLHSLVTDVPLESRFRYDEDFGALRCTVGCQKLLLEFFNQAGTLIDSLTMTKTPVNITTLNIP